MLLVAAVSADPERADEPRVVVHEETLPATSQPNGFDTRGDFFSKKNRFTRTQTKWESSLSLSHLQTHPAVHLTLLRAFFFSTEVQSRESADAASAPSDSLAKASPAGPASRRGTGPALRAPGRARAFPKFTGKAFLFCRGNYHLLEDPLQLLKYPSYLGCFGDLTIAHGAQFARELAAANAARLRGGGPNNAPLPFRGSRLPGPRSRSWPWPWCEGTRRALSPLVSFQSSKENSEVYFYDV